MASYFSWLHIFNRTDPTWLGIFQNKVKTFLRNIIIFGLDIALKLIKDRRIV